MTNNLLILELQWLGLPPEAVEALSSVWANATHHIKTKYGVSETFYCNSIEWQLFGPCQGSTLGPFLWLILFTLIVSSIDPGIHRINLYSADNSIHIEDIGEAFVDDSFLGCTSTHRFGSSLPVETNRRLAEYDSITKLHTLAQQWEWLLFATGGAICLSESFWYLISWKWSKSGTAKLSSMALSPDSLKLTSRNDLNSAFIVPRVEHGIVPR
jgi:hypothetical protein